MGPLGWHSREAEGRQESVPKQSCGRFKRRKMLGEPQSLSSLHAAVAGTVRSPASASPDHLSGG